MRFATKLISAIALAVKRMRDFDPKYSPYFEVFFFSFAAGMKERVFDLTDILTEQQYFY